MPDATATLKFLQGFRRRELLIRAVWALARLAAVVLLGLMVACAVDWWIDRRQHTPLAVRGTLLGMQSVIALAAAVWFLLPAVRRPGDDELALVSESKVPALHHRLITTVQFHRSGAAIGNVSRELIAAVGREAAALMSRVPPASLADHRRLKWAGWIAGAAAAIVAAVLTLIPDTARSLLARQFFFTSTVPRSIALSNQTDAIQPAGEPVMLRFGIDGPWPGHGELQIITGNGATENLAIRGDVADGVIAVKIAPPSGDFRFLAWIGDGRLQEPGHVRLVPRPAVEALAAALILPQYCGLKPDGTAYERLLQRGEVAGVAGCSTWVFARTQKPVARAELQLLSDGAEKKTTRVLTPLESDGTTMAFRFELKNDESSYSIHVWDEHGFANLDPPTRDVRLLPDEPPTVVLLAEQFTPESYAGPTEEFEADGVPVPMGGAVRIGYAANHPYGLGQANLVYRINEGDWRRLRLTETPATEATGPFDPKRGCFQNSQPVDQVQFHALPSADVTVEPGRLDGGGRLDFQTRNLPGIKVGDQLEYFVEVSNRNPDQQLAGRSEVRAKRVVTVSELVEWINGTLRQEDRIRRLTDRQRGVFDRAAPGG